MVTTLNSNMKLKKIGQNDGTSPVTFNKNDYTELLIIATNNASHSYNFNIPTDILTNTDMVFRNGFYLTPQNFGEVFIRCKSDSVSLGRFTVEDRNVTSDATIHVYGRM